MSASDLLMEIMVGQGIPEEKAQVIAERIMAEGIVDRRAVTRKQILADPCRDYKVVRDRYGCPTSFVYAVWNERSTVKVFLTQESK